jgi:hypothetical protein
MEKDITLLEALTGCDFIVDYFDGQQFRVQSPKG